LAKLFLEPGAIAVRLNSSDIEDLIALETLAARLAGVHLQAIA
jgi:hypothetical protein